MSKKINELTTKINSYEVTDPDRQVSAEEYNTILTTVQQHERNFVREDGNYPKMSVGFANNLIGRGEATAEEFTYRPTNGENSIEDEVARVTKIKGNSVVWNQLLTPRVGTYTLQGLTIIIDETGKVNVTGTSTSQAGIAIGIANIVSGRKYLYIGIPKDINERWWWSDQTLAHDSGSGVITTPTYPDENRYFVINVTEGTTVDITFYPKVYDLTKMFGADNEPTTVEEFYARIPSGIDTTAYNEGEIINLNTEAIKTVGFNQWDEQWELGGFNTTTGINNANTNQIRSKLIQIIPNTTYYIKNTGCYAMFYDSKNNIVDANIILISSDGTEKQAIKNGNSFWLNNTAFITPQTASLMKFYNTSEYGAAYKNDICINLSHTGWKNGTYEPYREFTREIPVIKKYFPDGMKKAGNAFDSIEWDSSKQKWVAVQRIGSVDLGAIQFITVTSSEDGIYRYNCWSSNIEAPNTFDYYETNIICSQFVQSLEPSNNIPESIVCGRYENEYIFIIKTSKYATLEAFTTAMQGVMLNYELAEPIATEIEDEYLNFDYDAEDFGTEEALSSVPSAAFSADIIYKFNAVDSIRQNRLDIKALQELVLSLQSQIASIQAQGASTLIE